METWRLSGKWEFHKEHGRQLNVLDGYPVYPDNSDEMIALLAGDRFSGVGIATASRLIKYYGDKLWEILEYRPYEILRDGILTNKSRTNY